MTKTRRDIAEYIKTLGCSRWLPGYDMMGLSGVVFEYDKEPDRNMWAHYDKKENAFRPRTSTRVKQYKEELAKLNEEFQAFPRFRRDVFNKAIGWNEFLATIGVALDEATNDVYISVGSGGFWSSFVVPEGAVEVLTSEAIKFWKKDK